MTRSPAKLWVAAGAAAAVLLTLVGWLFVVTPQRDAAAAHWDELSAAQLQSASLRVSNAKLESQMDDIETRRAGLELKRDALPQTNELDALLAGVSQAATTAGVTVDELTVMEPVDIALALTATTPVTDEATDEADDEADDEAEVEVVAPVVEPFYSLPITVRAVGPLVNLQEFLRLLQEDQARAILVANVTLALNEGSASLEESGVLTAETQVFVSPGAAVAPVAPGAAAPTG